MTKGEQSAPPAVDVVVVGGGIGGLYAAMRLAEHRLNVHLYELTDRLGGRIETHDLTPEASTPDEVFKAEMGPMRFELAMQPLFDSVRKSCGISVAEFASPSAPYLPDPEQLAVNEKIDDHPLDALGLLKLGLFRLFEIDHRLELDDEGVVQVIPTGEGLRWLKRTKDADIPPPAPDAAEYAETFDYVRATRQMPAETVPVGESVFLRDEGLWNALDAVLSPAAVHAIHELGPFFHFLPENLSAVEWGIFWLRYFHPDGSRTTMTTIPDGTETVIRTIAEKLGRDLRGSVEVKTNSEVTFVAPHGDGVKLTVKSGLTESEVVADHAILAIPTQALVKLADGFPEDVREKLDDVNPFPMVKVFFVFETPAWWRDLIMQMPAQRGARLLPTREVHYFPPKKPGKYTMVLLYADAPATTFWQHLLKDPDHHYQAEVGCNKALERQLTTLLTHLEVELANQHLRPGVKSRPAPYRAPITQKIASLHEVLNTGLAADDAVRREEAGGPAAERLVDLVLGKVAPSVIRYAIRDWSRGPFGAASHCWRPGSDSNDVRNRLAGFPLDRQSSPTVHVVGEAYSDYQGFIEGALRSAELAIDRILNAGTT